MKDPRKYIRPVALNMTLDEAVVLAKALEGICSNGPERVHGRWAAKLCFRINAELPLTSRIHPQSAAYYYKGTPPS